MDLLEITKYGIKNLRIRHLRSTLTIVGIVLGIATIVTLMSIGEGVSQEIESQLDAFGTDMIFVVPFNLETMSSASSMSMSTSGKLYERDIDYIEKVPGVEETARVNYGRASLRFRDIDISSAIYPADEAMFEQFGDYFTLEEGRYYTDSDTKVLVLGNDAANLMFDEQKIAPGNVIYVNDEPYRVVGVLKRIGTALSQQDDSTIFMPYDQGKKVLADYLAPGEVFAIYIKIRPGYDADEVAAQVERQIANAHRISLDKKDFSVITPSFIKETVGTVLDLLNLFLLAIAAVSAFVGGIGISNTMFMSVLERRREIGVLKAIGATRNTILLIFVFESALIGAGGGMLGLALGYLALLAAGAFGVPYILGAYQISFAFSFAVVVGVISGLIPALNASKVPAVEALHYE
ncbi:MAG: ABC transporter permease [Candidatus ainarchaeum sp.]|nr:ABC transporter permease [Candidatus ainarchaeum sp.]MDD5096155.1 ABC transporter permease [Candidatus ainarchaeum sp.]